MSEHGEADNTTAFSHVFPLTPKAVQGFLWTVIFHFSLLSWFKVRAPKIQLLSFFSLSLFFSLSPFPLLSLFFFPCLCLLPLFHLFFFFLPQPPFLFSKTPPSLSWEILSLCPCPSPYVCGPLGVKLQGAMLGNGGWEDIFPWFSRKAADLKLCLGAWHAALPGQCIMP